MMPFLAISSIIPYRSPTYTRILGCTLPADAEFVVTGDKKHLLPLGSLRGVSIVGLADFLAAYSGDSRWKGGCARYWWAFDLPPVHLALSPRSVIRSPDDQGQPGARAQGH